MSAQNFESGYRMSFEIITTTIFAGVAETTFVKQKGLCIDESGKNATNHFFKWVECNRWTTQLIMEISQYIQLSRREEGERIQIKIYEYCF